MTEQEHIELLRLHALAEARRAEIANCKYCQENKGKMAPRHFASPNCQSGRHNHCSCDTCF